MNVVICGPGGAGKGTLVARLLERDPSLWLRRSWTTRAQRPGEADDAYVFATPAEFDAHGTAGGFVRSVEVLDCRHGTPLPHPTEG